MMHRHKWTDFEAFEDTRVASQWVWRNEAHMSVPSDKKHVKTTISGVQRFCIKCSRRQRLETKHTEEVV